MGMEMGVVPSPSAVCKEVEALYARGNMDPQGREVEWSSEPCFKIRGEMSENQQKSSDVHGTHEHGVYSHDRHPITGGE